MVLSKRVVGLCLFILLLSQSLRLNYAQEPAATPSQVRGKSLAGK